MDEIEYMRMEENAALSRVFDNILTALKKYDTRRWDWKKIHCCLTGKDADLEPWGDQGIELVTLSEDTVTITAHGYKSITGQEVCLNFPEGLDENDDATFEKYREIYLTHAQHVVCGADSDGTWDGDDWGLTFEETETISLREPDPALADDDYYDLVAKDIIAKAEERLAPWEKDVSLADELCNQLAGWTDSEGGRCEEGKPDMECSVFNPHYDSSPEG